MEHDCTLRLTVVDLTSCLFNYQLKAALWEVQSLQIRWSHMPSISFKRQASFSFYILFRAQRLLVKCYKSCNIEPDMQCTYNVTMRRVRAIIVAGENIIITYSECVFVDLGIQHEIRICHVVTFVLPGSTRFLHSISQTVRYLKKLIWH